MTEVRAECYRQNSRQVLTRSLLLPVTSECADDGILLPRHTVDCAVDVLLRLRGLVFGLSLLVLFASRLLPGLEPGRVANYLDHGTLHGVVLDGGLAVLSKGIRQGWNTREEEVMRTLAQCWCWRCQSRSHG